MFVSKVYLSLCCKLKQAKCIRYYLSMFLPKSFISDIQKVILQVLFSIHGSISYVSKSKGFFFFREKGKYDFQIFQISLLFYESYETEDDNVFCLQSRLLILVCNYLLEVRGSNSNNSEITRRVVRRGHLTGTSDRYVLLGELVEKNSLQRLNCSVFIFDSSF